MLDFLIAIQNGDDGMKNSSKSNNKGIKNSKEFSKNNLFLIDNTYYKITMIGILLLLLSMFFTITIKFNWSDNFLSQGNKVSNSLVIFVLLALEIIIFAVIIAFLISQQKSQQKIFQLAYFDSLTDLPNRKYFEDVLPDFVDEVKKYNYKVALIYIDLDNFKVVNDTLGHALGDKFLKQIGHLIKKCLRHSDFVCRFEGDEFVILLPGINNKEDAINVVERIIDVLQIPFTSYEKKFYITASIGIAIYPDDSDDIHTIVKYATMAMNSAKENGKNSYCLFESHMNTKLLEKYELEEDLRQALINQEFVLYYQPQIDISTGKIVGLEALIRWMHPIRGCLAPMEFIPLAEETGLIVPIGEWVIRTACSQSIKWKKKGIKDLRISVNLSARQFQQPDLVEVITEILNETGMDPQLLDLEITESVAMRDIELTKKVLGELRGKKINISLDDFGTGYSSLNYLKQLPINTVKIDRTFVDNITDDINQQTIAKAVIDLSHNMELHVTAEGVETWEQFSFLKFQNCDKVQGYLFSMPLPLEDVERILYQDKKFIDKSEPLLSKSY